MQVQDHRQMQSPLAGPDVADITRPFLVRSISREVTIQQVRRSVERVIAVRRRLEFSCSFNDELVLPHQPHDPAVPHIDPNFLQFFSHSRLAIAAKADA